MLTETTPQLIRHFWSRNGWIRDTAQKLIILRNDRDTVVPLLQAIVRYNIYDPLPRLHALWTLEGIGAVDESLLLHAFKDRDWRVRAALLHGG